VTNLRNWLMDANGAAIVGADVYVYDASLSHPNPNALISQTVTDPNGMFTFSALTDTEKDIKVQQGLSGPVTWFKGLARHSISDLVAGNIVKAITLQGIGQGSTPTAPGTGIGMLYWKTDGNLYYQYASGGEIRVAKSTELPAAILTTTGDIIYASGAGVAARLGIGGTNLGLYVAGGLPAWGASTKSVLTTTGDIVYASSANTLARLSIGGANTVLHGGTTPSYSAVVQGDVSFTWTAFTPSISQNAGNTALANTGVNVGKYLILGKLVFIAAELFVGATAGTATNAIFLLLPSSAPNLTLASSGAPLTTGEATYLQSGVSYKVGTAVIQNANRVGIQRDLKTDYLGTAGDAFTLATNDTLSWNIQGVLA
jgi:hypothetical protein